MIISATLDITAVQGYYSICHNKLTLEYHYCPTYPLDFEYMFS